MPGPTTEVLNEDIKELKADIRDIRSNLDSLRSDVHAIALSVGQLSAEVKFSLAVARWVASVVVLTALTGGASAIWWTATSAAQIKQTAADVDAMKKLLEAQKQAPTGQPSIKDVPKP